MDIRRLTDDYAVSPQITPEDLSALRDAGFTTVICNRPDAEVPPELSSDAMRAAVEAAGMAFVHNPVVGASLGMQQVEVQGKAIAAAPGPVFAYCASGNRSSIVWALSQAGTRPTDDLIEAAARFGYVNVAGFRDQIDALAADKG